MDITVALSDGTTARIPSDIDDIFRGVYTNVFGERCLVVVVPEIAENYLVPLTPCCNASGKGSADVDSHVVCRSCYQEVDSSHGGSVLDTEIARRV